jgi:NAD(P)H-dependent FMN reductase
MLDAMPGRRIVTICGTSRPGNYTVMALSVVEDELGREGLGVTRFDPAANPLNFPGLPETEGARRLRQDVLAAAAIVVATPEYHGGFSAMTKLVIENLGFPSVLQGKPVALLGVAAGRIGAIKSVEQLRGICAHTGALVLPRSLSVAGVRGAFDKTGKCTDPDTESALRGLVHALLDFLKDYVCPKYTLEEIVRREGKPWTAEV